MNKENKEFILDMGIGAGGAYIKNDTASHEQRVGIDLDHRSLLNLRENYPEVIPFIANAERLPFKENSFSRIVTVFPGKILVPGLLTNHSFLKEEVREQFSHKEFADGWYPEFSRVLKPGGKLEIYGDFYADPEQIKKTSARFFEITQIRQLTQVELEKLGTEQSAETLMPLALEMIPLESIFGKTWEKMHVKIDLRSRKRPRRYR